MNASVLTIKDLSVDFVTEFGTVQAVDEVNFSIARREIVGLVGESGSGKTVTALSILRLVSSPPGYYRAGEIFFHGKDLLKINQTLLRKIRGSQIAFIFQDPMTSLNPIKTVGRQIAETIRLHRGLSRKDAFQEAIQMMDRVGIPLSTRRAREFPHQFSGGMRQRVMIAMALSCNPLLLIADEPTTALDVTIQAQILEMMQQLYEKYQSSILLITHDLGVIAQMCHRVITMYAGKVVEIGPVREIFLNPQHPYTQALLKSRPQFGRRGRRLNVIPGTVPNLIRPPDGCRFHNRCDYAVPICQKETPHLIQTGENHWAACHLLSNQVNI